MDFLEILELCQTNLVMTDSINHKKWQFLSRDRVSSQQCRARMWVAAAAGRAAGEAGWRGTASP